MKKVKKRKKKKKNLLNMISSDVVGIISCHHGLHLHQVLLHLREMNDGFSKKQLIFFSSSLGF